MLIAHTDLVLSSFCECVLASCHEYAVANLITFVDIGLGVVGHLVLLVKKSILGGAGAGANVGVAVLGNVLVGFLGSLGTGALDGLSNVIGGVLS